MDEPLLLQHGRLGRQCGLSEYLDFEVFGSRSDWELDNVAGIA